MLEHRPSTLTVTSGLRAGYSWIQRCARLRSGGDVIRVEQMPTSILGDYAVRDALQNDVQLIPGTA